MANPNILLPTDCIVESATITSLKDGRPISIKDQLLTFQYIERVDAPYVVGKIDLIDSAGLINILPIQGGEPVSITVSTFKKDFPQKYDFVIWTVQNRFVQQNKQTYSIGLISKEALTNEIVRVKNKLVGNPADIALTLLKTGGYINSDKDVFSEPSKFDVSLIAKRRRPFDIINEMAKKSVSVNAVYTSDTTAEEESSTSETLESVRGSAGFLFWETKRGYNFFSVDSLCADPSDNDSESFPTSPLSASHLWGPYEEKAGNLDNEDGQFNILESNFISEVDILHSLRRGKYSSLMVFFNHSTGQYDEYVYKLSDTYDSMTQLGNQQKVSLVKVDANNLGDYPSRIMSILLDHETWYNGKEPASPEPSDGSTSPSQYSDRHKFYASQSIARYELLKNQACVVVIPGNIDICAGDQVNINLINKVPQQGRSEQLYDPESSGRYLIAEVTHKFENNSSIPEKYLTTLRLLRDSYGNVESNRGS